jgi:hypothetical protein
LRGQRRPEFQAIALLMHRKLTEGCGLLILYLAVNAWALTLHVRGERNVLQQRQRHMRNRRDVVVTNHTLLAIEIVDSHPILPERDAVILDEAHEFMDRTTQAVTEELTRRKSSKSCCHGAKISAWQSI